MSENIKTTVGQLHAGARIWAKVDGYGRLWTAKPGAEGAEVVELDVFQNTENDRGRKLRNMFDASDLDGRYFATPMRGSRVAWMVIDDIEAAALERCSREGHFHISILSDAAASMACYRLQFSSPETLPAIAPVSFEAAVTCGDPDLERDLAEALAAAPACPTCGGREGFHVESAHVLRDDHMAALVEHCERAFASGDDIAYVVVDFTRLAVARLAEGFESNGRRFRTIAGALGLNPVDAVPQGVTVEMVKGTETFRVDIDGVTRARAHCAHFPTDRWTLIVGGAWGGCFSRAEVLAHLGTVAAEGACRPLAHYRGSAGVA